MSEDEWLTSTDPVAMVRFVRDATESFRTRWLGWVSGPRFRVSQRKWRLLACAVVRRIEGQLREEFRGWAVDTIERAAEGTLHGDGLLSLAAEVNGAYYDTPDLRTRAALVALREAADTLPRDLEDVLTSAASAADPLLDASSEAFAEAIREGRHNEEPARQADLVRCVLGNPLGDVQLAPAWVHANDAAAHRIARSIHDERRYGELPILADALEDGGCDSQAILNHCRALGLHARGCWVVDRILGFQ